MVRLGAVLALAAMQTAGAETTCSSTPEGWSCPANNGCVGTCNDPKWQDWVVATNLFRCMHDVPSVSWSEPLAGNTATQFQNAQAMEHSDSYKLAPPFGPSGENLYKGSEAPEPIDVVRMWYQEIQHCATLAPGCVGTDDKVTGHYTALVWAGAETIGCTINEHNLAACRYKGTDTLTCKTPNMKESFEDNVFPASQTIEDCYSKMQGCGFTVPLPKLANMQPWEKGKEPAAPPPPPVPAPGSPIPAANAAAAGAVTDPGALGEDAAGADAAAQAVHFDHHGYHAEASMPADILDAKKLDHIHVMGESMLEGATFAHGDLVRSFSVGAVVAGLAAAAAVAWRGRGSASTPLASEAVVEE